MRILKIALMCLATTIWLNPAQAMEEQPLTKPFPKEIWHIIIKELSPKEWTTFLSVSKSWQEPIEKMFHALVLDMGNWNKTLINTGINDVNFATIERVLIKNLERQLLDEHLPITATNKIDLVSFLLAHYSVNLHAAKNAASDAAKNKAAKIEGDIAKGTTWSALKSTMEFDLEAICKSCARIKVAKIVQKSAWHDAESATSIALKQLIPIKIEAKLKSNDIKITAQYSAWHDAEIAEVNAICQEAIKGAFKNAQVAAEIHIKVALEKISDEKIEDYGWELGNLYVLAHIAQDIFINEYFKKAFDEAKNKLDNEPDFNPSIENVLGIFAKEIELKNNNPHLLSLKRIVEHMTEKLLRKQP